MNHRSSDLLLPALLRLAQDVMKNAKIGDKEMQVFSLFYDEKFKVRREVIPKFQMFGTLCDGKLEEGWETIMRRTEEALRNLRRVGWIEVAHLSPLGELAGERVGPAIETYRLTATGLEVLQKLHPPIALQLRGWIAVLPPWAVLISTIAGAIGVVWKIIDLVAKLLS
ncbi:MAG: hypothetical protein HUU08_12440 [Candidatus Brocadia sp.]|nr:hypothetical protein [Candidatus Brocadia sp.]